MPISKSKQRSVAPYAARKASILAANAAKTSDADCADGDGKSMLDEGMFDQSVLNVDVARSGMLDEVASPRPPALWILQEGWQSSVERCAVQERPEHVGRCKVR